MHTYKSDCFAVVGRTTSFTKPLEQVHPAMWVHLVLGSLWGTVLASPPELHHKSGCCSTVAVSYICMVCSHVSTLVQVLLWLFCGLSTEYKTEQVLY